MKLGLINSAFAQAGKGTRFGLETTKQLGFDTVDIFTDPLDIDAAERRLIRETCRDLDLPIVPFAIPSVPSTRKVTEQSSSAPSRAGPAQTSSSARHRRPAPPPGASYSRIEMQMPSSWAKERAVRGSGRTDAITRVGFPNQNRKASR